MNEELKVVNNAPEQTKVKKEKSKARKIVEWVLFGIFGALFAFILVGNISGWVNQKDNYGQQIRFGYGVFIVTTSSMEPEIPTKSAIITHKDKVEDFVTKFNNGETVDLTFFNIETYIDFEPDTPEFKRANGGQAVYARAVMTHRLREVHVDESVEYGQGRYIFVTAGINISDRDEDKSKKGQYQYFTEQQYLGVVKVTNAPLGHVFNFIASPIGLIILLLIPGGYLIAVSSIDIFKTMKEAENAESSGEKVGNLSKLSDEDRARLKKELLEEMIKNRKGADNNENK